MNELRAEDAAAFMDRWDDFHDAEIRTVEFTIADAKVAVRILAQDRTADWATRELLIVVEQLSDYSFRQPPAYETRTVFEAGLIWDGTTVLLALDAPPHAEATVDGFRGSDTYFAGRRLAYDVLPTS